jgi:hypothetical protein
LRIIECFHFLVISIMAKPLSFDFLPYITGLQFQEI